MKLLRMPDVSQRWLRDLIARVNSGSASDQEKVNAAAFIGKHRAHEGATLLWRLVEDPDEQVRYFALQSLVLDLGQKGARETALCWRLLEEDSARDVRGMAAACLGGIFHGSRSRMVFERLVKILKDEATPPRVAGSIYEALFRVAGRPVTEWPVNVQRERLLSDGGVDWRKVAELQDVVMSRDED